MHRFIPLIVLSVALPACPEPSPHVEPVLTALRADLAHSTAGAASVALWLDGEVIWVGGVGSVNPTADGPPPDEDTLFSIGSDTKKLTAIAVLQQVAAGAITLETTVAEALPALTMASAPGFGAATIRQLLSHQSGIVDDVELTTTTTDAGLADYAYGEFAAGYTSIAPPGRFHNYSNPGYAIAGLINQELDGRPWPDLVEQDVLAPLGMDRTVARRSEVDGNVAIGVGHSVVGDGSDAPHPIPLADSWESAFVRPAGLVWSTPSDQARLAGFLVDGDPAVLPPALRAELVAPQVALYPDLPPSYGLGLYVARGVMLDDGWHDVPVWSHGGFVPSGYSSAFVVLPEQRFAISILASGDVDVSGTIAAAIETMIELPAPTVAPSPPFDPDALDGMVGTYADTTGRGDLVVTRDRDVLMIDLAAADEAGIPYDHAMVATSTRVWNATIAGQPYDFAFIGAPDGAMYLRNREVVFVRPPAITESRIRDRELSVSSH